MCLYAHFFPPVRLDVNFVDTNLFRQSIKIDFNLSYF